MSQQQTFRWKAKNNISEVNRQIHLLNQKIAGNHYMPTSTGYRVDNLGPYTSNVKVAKLPSIEGYVPLNSLQCINLLLNLGNEFGQDSDNEITKQDYLGFLTRLQTCIVENANPQNLVNLLNNQETKDIIKRVFDYLKLEKVAKVEQFIFYPSIKCLYTFSSRSYSVVPRITSSGQYLRPFYSTQTAVQVHSRSASLVKTNERDFDNDWAQVCISEEDAVRCIIRAILGKSTDLTKDQAILFTSKEGFTSFVIDDKAQYSLRNLSNSLANFQHSVFINVTRSKNFELPIKVVDLKAETVEVDIRCDHKMSNSYVLPKALFQRKDFIKNLLKTTFNIEATDPESYRLALVDMQEQLRFKGTFVVKEVEEPIATGDLITPEELEEISQFLNATEDSNMSEPRVEVSEVDYEESYDDYDEDPPEEEQPLTSQAVTASL